MTKRIQYSVVALLLSASIVAVCNVVAATKPDPLGLYSVNYQEARARFLREAAARDGQVTSFRNPVPGPNGEALYTDVARFGPPRPESVLVVSSGTHGVEGFAGSAIQLGLLQDASKVLFPPRGPGVGLVFIHAVNPYGFAHLRRFNEDNVDINRNFRDHATPAPRNEGYDELHDVIAPASLSVWGNLWARIRLYWFRLWHGAKALQSAVSLGQYSHPDGLFYGGNTESWSRRTIEEIMRRFVSGATRVIMIDIHTGLGPFGNAELITNVPKDSPAYRRAVEFWGESVRTTYVQESVSVQISGSMKLALTRLLPDAELTAVSLEFGTYPGPEVFWALREENWLQNHGGASHPDRQRIKAALLHMFYPDDHEWKRQVWHQGREVVYRAAAALR